MSMPSFFCDDCGTDVLRAEECPQRCLDFRDVDGLLDLARVLNRHPSIAAKASMVGIQRIEETTVGHVCVELGFAESVNRLRKNPTRITVNGELKPLDAPWTWKRAVVVVGKGRHLKVVVAYRDHER